MSDDVSPILWAKKDADTDAYHPLARHLADVANVARLMWERCVSTLLRSATEADLGLNGDTTATVVAFLAGLHDLGKASPGFQRLQQGRTPHGIITAREVTEALSGAEALAQPAVAGILAKIVGAHHGVFPSAYDIRGLRSDALGDRKWAEVRLKLARDLWRTLHGEDNQSVILDNEEPTNPATVPVLAGLISVADWIGSNTDHFPFDSETDTELYLKRSPEQARSGLTSIGWLPTPVYAEPAPFESIFRFPANDVQRIVCEQVEKQTRPFLLAIEAQMGQGKTEAALYAADSSLCGGRARGLYVALPTQATSNAMFDRVKNDYLEKRGHSNLDDNFQLVHGNALLDELARVSGVESDDSGNDLTVSARSWFTARKRPLLAPFGVGTIDQALLSVLQTRHWFVRLFGLANKVVIFDEVHAYDTYTSTLLDRLIEWLSALECTVILLSATLPSKRMSELVTAYGGKQELELADYPRITLANRDECSCVHVSHNHKPTPVTLEFESDDPSSVALLASSRLSDGGCAAVICNTVDRAQCVFEIMQEEMSDCDLILFHARTPFLWRKETEEEVRRKFGKPGKDGRSPDRPHRAVVVATQVIEQSLDLDFDWLLTDMAPIDLILQRLGREHRHKRPRRPAAVSSPILTILSDGEVGGPPPKFENAGIYERYVLLLSWLAISRQNGVILLPDDIDPLVQEVYGDEEPRRLDAEWIEALRASSEDAQYEREEAAKKACKLLIPKPGYPEDIIAKFNKQLGEDDDPDVHESVRAATRDGNPSIQVACLRREGDKLYPMRGAAQVDLGSEPDKSLIGELLGSSLSIQKKGLYHALRRQDPPTGWKNSPHLRYHRAVEFVDGLSHDIKGYCLQLSREFGLAMHKEIG